MGSTKHIRNNGEHLNIHGHDNYQMPGAYKQMGDMNKNQPAKYDDGPKKELKGDQDQLPIELQEAIKAAPEQPGKISGGAAAYMRQSYGVNGAGKIGDPETTAEKVYIGETDSDRSDQSKRFDKKNPGARDSDAISRYRIEKEYDPSGVYYTGDTNMYSKDKTMVPGIRNPNYNPGSNATAEFNKLYPNIKNIAAKSSMINKASLATFGGNTSNHNKGFMQNKGNYGVGQVNDFGGVNNSGNKKLFIKNLKQAHNLASTPLNVKSAKATFGKTSTPSNQEFNSLTKEVSRKKSKKK